MRGLQFCQSLLYSPVVGSCDSVRLGYGGSDISSALHWLLRKVRARDPKRKRGRKQARREGERVRGKERGKEEKAREKARGCEGKVKGKGEGERETRGSQRGARGEGSEECLANGR